MAFFLDFLLSPPHAPTQRQFEENPFKKRKTHSKTYFFSWLFPKRTGKKEKQSACLLAQIRGP